MGIFTEYEIYELVSAQDCAQKVKQESGYSSDYNEFIPENSDIEEKLTELENNNQLEEFESLLNDAAKNSSNLFDDLINLNADDFEEEPDFFEARREIQDEIIDKSLELLRDYCE